ncbi:uncharacterized protein TNCV_4695561 [Trichonephila clavipes]|nr:uncharacterized protein TNCV_4695561 [Trichonephila clavipes]
MSVADIHRQIKEVYSTEAMSDNKVQKWVRELKDGRTNIHDEERSGRHSVITDNLMQAVETKIQILLSVGSQTSNNGTQSEDIALALNFLIRYEEGDYKLSRIVSGDEKWAFFITPDSKQQSMEG